MPDKRNNDLESVAQTNRFPTPLLSVVVPFFNRARHLERTLNSIAAQTARPLRVVLVDNASSDASLEIARAWAEKVQAPDFTVDILSEERRGAAAARNRGLEAVSSPWVMFFDSDDVMTPNHVANFLECIHQHPDAQLVGRPIKAVSPAGKHIYHGVFTTRRPEFNHLFHGILSTQRWAALTALVREAGGWNPKLMAWDDLELGLRMLLLRPRMSTVPGPESVRVEVHDDSITGSCFSLSPSKWLYALDVCEQVCDQANRPDLSRWVDCRRAILAANLHREGSHSDAARIMHSLLKSKPAAVKRKLKVVFFTQKLLGCGASSLSKFLFPPIH